MRGEHRFDIEGYSRKQGAGNVLTSATFAVGGFDWAIRYYPDDGRSVRVRLRPARDTERHRAGAVCWGFKKKSILGLIRSNKAC